MNPWTNALQNWAPSFLSNHPVLRSVSDSGTVLLHGSTTLGIDDPFSDLDLWLLIPERLLTAVFSSGTRFFPFELRGKPGHINVESLEAFQRRVSACDFPLIAELRRAEVLCGETGTVSALLERARQPLSETAGTAWFRCHYILMRQAHRALDNPIERGDAPTVLFGVSAAIEHALQAALILDGEPYPYVKWLHHAAVRTPTGAKLVPLVAEVLDLLATDMLRHPGPEGDHPLSRKLKEIRRVLIAAAREKGIDGPWLETWWLFIDTARDAVQGVTWNGKPPD